MVLRRTSDAFQLFSKVFDLPSEGLQLFITCSSCHLRRHFPSLAPSNDGQIISSETPFLSLDKVQSLHFLSLEDFDLHFFS